MKKIYSLLALIIVASLLLVACGSGNNGASSGFVEGGSDFHTPTEVPTEAPTEEAEPEMTYKVCQVTDTGGIDDKSFNQTAWKGVEDAMAGLGVEGLFLES
ncbi:MAG: hypothetical protein N2D54_13010, partial [Chloroflexota bacterium]